MTIKRLDQMTWDEMQRATGPDEPQFDTPDYYGQGQEYVDRMARYYRGKPRTIKSLKPSEIPLGMLGWARDLGY